MNEFLYCLNTSTIQPAPLMEKIRAAQRAGYDAIELWVFDVEAHVESGGKLADVRKALDDAGLQRPSMIYLKGWCEEDPAALARETEVIRQRLDIARELGVSRFVAGPPGVRLSLAMITDRYRKLLEISVTHGVPASIEFLGFSPGVWTLEQAWQICRNADHPAATVTPDAWHMFRGDTAGDALAAVPPDRISIFHWDDAPAQPPRKAQTDEDRVMPGEGILPLRALAAQLRGMNYRGALSLELFHRGLWKEDPLEVARRGLAAMRESVSER